jgi:replication factor C large subunit
MVLEKENTQINPGRLIKLISDSNGDIRSMLNSAQALITGFEPLTERTFELLDVEEGINAFYKSQTIDEARAVLYSMRIDPRTKINAFYSSVITSSVSNLELEHFLQVISEADVLYGQIMKTQEWRLLRYLDSILLRLYKKDTTIRYSQYNLSWQVLNRLRWDGSKFKSLAANLSKQLHISSSTFATFYLPYILFCMRNDSLELEFDDNYNELIEKEIELL